MNERAEKYNATHGTQFADNESLDRYLGNQREIKAAMGTMFSLHENETLNKDRVIHLNISSFDRERLKGYAKKSGITQTAILRRMIHYCLDDLDRQEEIKQEEQPKPKNL